MRALVAGSQLVEEDLRGGDGTEKINVHHFPVIGVELRSKLGGQRLKPVHAPGQKRHLEPVRMQGPCRCRPDSGRGAGDDRYLSRSV
ncbi:hypothetical protein GCM10009688_00530 [Arthrobacter gandavensis]|uniref:Uncharacterized protein n=1 Tax=Arthrobacter gandavensis TaxID=169960 RepID=A0ABN2NSD9_9MICC